MKNWSCAFFGHSIYYYGPYYPKLKCLVVDLINRGVTHFYNGFRGAFDQLCADLVYLLRKDYPHIKNVLVLSYKPKPDFVLPMYFDEAIYLQDNNVPPKFAICNTNRKLVQSVDFIISGVERLTGGAKSTCDYAKRALKSMYNIVTNETQYWYVSPRDIENTIREHEKRLKTDDEYCKKRDEHVQKLVDIAEKYVKKCKKRKTKDNSQPVWVTVEIN